MTSLQLNALPRYVIKRFVYGSVALVAVLAALALVVARDRAATRVHDAAMQSAWQSATPLAGPTLTREALFARFAIKQAGANSDLSWQAASMTELRASLLAFDLAQIRLNQVKLTRDGAGFVVTAEPAP